MDLNRPITLQQRGGPAHWPSIYLAWNVALVRPTPLNQHKAVLTTATVQLQRSERKLLGVLFLFCFFLEGEMAGTSLETRALECPICFELLRNPVTLPCGHSFCTSCIENSWPPEQQRREQHGYPCPHCRKRFRSRPELNKNIILAELVEQLKKTAPPADRCAGPQDVACDICVGRKKLKALKSCLQCVISYCDTHLQPHHTVAMLQKHQLVAPSNKLQENICHQHNEVKKMYCRTDQQPLCGTCCTELHKDHDTVKSADERALKQAELEAKKDRILNSIQNKTTQMQMLPGKIHALNQTHQRVEKSCKSYSDMLDFIKTTWQEIFQQVCSEMCSELNQKKHLQNKLQCEVSDLKKIVSELEEVSSIQEHNHFLLLYASAPAAPDAPSTNPPSTQSKLKGPVTPVSPAYNSQNAVNLTRLMQDVIKLKDTILSTRRNLNLPNPISVCVSEPMTRQDLLCFRQLITIDPNTVCNSVSLSEENKRATFESQRLQYPDHPDRFLSWGQVLSTHGMIGRSYWEVDVSRAKRLCVAVSYKDIGRKDYSDSSNFGKNVNSWALTRDNNKYTFHHNSVQTDIRTPVPVEPKIGVYLDHRAGTLSFFSLVEDTATLFYRVQTTFTKPLYAGLSLGFEGDTARFAELLF